MERRAMQQAAYSPVVGQGIISGKAFVDHRRIEEARINAQDGGPQLGAYPGGESDDNLSVMPHELSFGLKEDRAMRYMMGGMANEMGLTALAGHRYADFDSEEAFMDNYYFQGVVDTEYRVGSGDDPEHGYAFSRAGSKTINNNGSGDIFAGDLVCYTIPPTPKSTGKNPNRIVHQNRAGTPNTKYLWEVQRFDYTDFSTQIAGSFACMKASSFNADRGIADVGLSSFFDRNGTNDAKALTNLQSQAMGYKYGLLGAGLVMVEYLLRTGVVSLNDEGDRDAIANAQAAQAGEQVREIANNVLNLFSTDLAEQTVQQDILSEIFLQNLPYGTAERTTAEKNFLEAHGKGKKMSQLAMSRLEGDQYAMLRANLMEILCSGIASSWYSKTSKIIGKAMNTAKPSGQLHLLLGHFKL